MDIILYSQVIAEWREELLKAVEKQTLANVTCIFKYVIHGDTDPTNVLEMAIQYTNQKSCRIPRVVMKPIIDTLLEARMKCEDIAEALMKNHDYSLYRFVYDGMDLEVFKKMIEKGADVNELDKYSNSALFYAMEHRLDKMCDILLRSGASINLKKRELRCLSFFSFEIFNSLVTNTVNINSLDEFGDTLLQTLIFCRDEIMRYQITLRDYDHYTEDFILCLLENGARFNLERECRCVEKHGSPNRLLSDAIDHLIDCEMTSDERIHFWHRTTKFGWLLLTKSFLERGIDINERDEDGFTPLHNFWLVNKPELPIDLERAETLLRLSIDYGADVCAKISSDIWMRSELLCPRGNCCNGECTILHLATFKHFIGLTDDLTEEYKKTISPIIEEIARLIHHGKSVNSADLEIIEEWDELKNYYGACKRELESMQARIFYKNITLSDVLDQGIMQQLGTLPISHLIRPSMENEYRDEYPIYSKSLINKFKRILQWQQLSRQASIILNDVFGSVIPVELIMYNLVVHLSLSDIRVITRGYKEN